MRINLNAKVMEIKSILNSFIDLIFPMRCIGCEDVIQSNQFLCVPCLNQLTYTHWQLNQVNIAFHKLNLLCAVEGATALFIFKSNQLIQQILHEMKYRNRPEIGAYLAELFVQDIQHIDGVIPMPLHPKRLKKRGYNQVEPFAKAIAENHKRPYLPQVLERTKHIESLVSRDRNFRLNALSNAFALKQPLPKGHYLLIDDILTTGATISSAVDQLKVQSQIKISVLTIAYAD